MGSSASKRLRIYQLTQQLTNASYWDFSDNASDAYEFERILTDAQMLKEHIDEYEDYRQQKVTIYQTVAQQLGDFLMRRLEREGIEIDEAHAIIHADDVQNGYNELKDKLEETEKPMHIHMVVKIIPRKKGGENLKDIARLMGVDPQYIETPRRGGNPVKVCGKTFNGQHDNMLAYLIHTKYTKKYQYPTEQVATLRGTPYKAIVLERLEAWKEGRAYVNTKVAKDLIESIVFKCATGQLSKAQILEDDELFLVYSTDVSYSRQIDNALAKYGERRARRAVQALESGLFKTQVIFVEGSSGSGKTRMVKAMVGEILRKYPLYGWYLASARNPFDDYNGEEIVIMDDARPDTLKPNEWLLLCDPYNASPMSARYKNKSKMAPQIIFITSTERYEQFFAQVADRSSSCSEELEQFIRRLTYVVQVVNVDAHDQYVINEMGKVESYTIYPNGLPFILKTGVIQQEVVVGYQNCAKRIIDTTQMLPSSDSDTPLLIQQ